MKIDGEKVYDLDSYRPLKKEDFNFEHNKNLHEEIKELISKHKTLPREILHNILTELISQFSDINYINSSKELYPQISFGDVEKEIKYQLIRQNFNYNNSQRNRINSIVFSKFIRYSLIKLWNLNKKTLNKFEFTLNGKYLVFDRNFDLAECYKKDIVMNSHNLFDKEEINYLIEKLQELDYLNGENRFERDIKLLENRMSKAEYSKVIGIEDIFRQDGYELFTKWVKLSDEDHFKKYSYIFQKLKELQKLRMYSFKDTCNFLRVNDFITETEYELWIIKDNWISPRNILSKSRNKQFESLSI